MKPEGEVEMEYKNLGSTGIKVSRLSFGNWINSDSNAQQTKQKTIKCVQKAWDLGINFFDTAEVYGFGQGQRQMGEALRSLNVPRHKYVLSTKIFWGTLDDIPNKKGLSRKHLIEGAKNSLKNLGVDYVDVIFAHRPDDTPMQQICRAFNWLIKKGYTNYWGTSVWRPDDIAQAYFICDRYNLEKPIAQQPEYNLYNRKHVQLDYRNLFADYKMGSTTFSPLLGGILTGKYNDGIPEGSRMSLGNPFADNTYFQFMVDRKDQVLESLNKFKELATELGCTMAQLALAWCLNNPDVTSVITGASSPTQVQENLKALKVQKLLTPEIQSRIEAMFKTAPRGQVKFITGSYVESRRFALLGYK